MMGQDKYEQQMIHLVNQMPGMLTQVGILGDGLLTPRSDGDDGDDK